MSQICGQNIEWKESEREGGDVWAVTNDSGSPLSRACVSVSANFKLMVLVVMDAVSHRTHTRTNALDHCCTTCLCGSVNKDQIKIAGRLADWQTD